MHFSFSWSKAEQTAKPSLHFAHKIYGKINNNNNKHSTSYQNHRVHTLGRPQSDIRTWSKCIHRSNSNRRENHKSVKSHNFLCSFYLFNFIIETERIFISLCRRSNRRSFGCVLRELSAHYRLQYIRTHSIHAAGCCAFVFVRLFSVRLIFITMHIQAKSSVSSGANILISTCSMTIQFARDQRTRNSHAHTNRHGEKDI